MVTSIEVEAPAETVWGLISDFARWPEWGPTVSGVESESTSVGPGITGSVVTPPGIRLPFLITEFVAGERWSWDVAGVEATGHVVIPAGEHRCRVEFSVPVVFFPYVAVLRMGLRRLKQLAETIR